MTPPFRLTTLGALDVTDGSGERADQLAAQQKRLALLVFLAVEGVRGPISRDSVSTVFWPRSDQRRARANLRNALHFLRSAIGSEAIEVIGDERIQLDPEVVRCDAAEALRLGLRPNAGVFLDGMHFRGAGTDFYDWVDRVRGRLERLPVATVELLPATMADDREADIEDDRTMVAGNPTSAGVEPSAAVDPQPSKEDRQRGGAASPPSAGRIGWRRPIAAVTVMLTVYVGLGQTGGRTPEAIGEIDRSGRALVFPFEMTGDSAVLDEVGALGASWILRRVGSSGVASVVSYGTLEAQLGPAADADITAAADSALTDFVILGRVMATEHDVTVEPRIVRATDLTEIPLPAETAPREQAVDAFDRAAERIVAALAAERSPTWRWPPFSPPPSLAILRLEKQAHDAFYELDYDLFHALADSAMALDTTYVSFPMLNLKASAFWNQRRLDPRNFDATDSVLAYLERRSGRLSPGERRGVQWMRGIVSGDLLSEFEAVDPASGAADRVPYRLAMTSRRMNRLHLARELIVRRYLMHPRGANYVAWDQVHLSTLARLRDYQALLDAAVEAQDREQDYGLFVQREAQALAGLDRIEEMEDVIALAATQPMSTDFNPVAHMASAAVVARAEGFGESARAYARRALDLAQEPMDEGVDLSRPLAQTYGVLGDWEAAVRALEEVVGEEAPPEIRLERLGLFGAALAAAGRDERAREVLNTLQDIAIDYERFYVFGVAQWHQARIHARLGEYSEAIALLSSALQRGQVHGTWEIWDPHWLLLRGDPRYEDLVRIRS